MNTTDCIFCKIIRGEVPSVMIYEDASTYVFLDQKPINPGHMLVVPKAHFTNIFDLPEEAFVAMTKTAQKVTKGLAQSLSIGDINVYMNNGAHSGQMVFHSHIHIIPRYENDGYGLWHGKEYPDASEALAVGELIKKALA